MISTAYKSFFWVMCQAFVEFVKLLSSFYMSYRRGVKDGYRQNAQKKTNIAILYNTRLPGIFL